jgi:hypothetical protein
MIHVQLIQIEEHEDNSRGTKILVIEQDDVVYQANAAARKFSNTAHVSMTAEGVNMKHCQAPVGSVSCCASLVVAMSKSCAQGCGQATKGCSSKRYREHGRGHSIEHAAVTHNDPVRSR